MSAGDASEDNQLALGLVCRPELEAKNSAAAEGVGELLQRLRTRRVLAALNPGDRLGGRADPFR